MLSSGAASSLTVDSSRTSYLYFDLSDVPSDAIVRWAKLRLFLPIVRTKGAGLEVHLVTSQWNEALASNMPSISAGTIGVIPPEKLGTKRFVTVDITNTVQGWISGGTINEGLAIAPVIRAGTSSATVMLTSKEGATMGLPAELDIEFKPDNAVSASIAVEQLPPTLRTVLTPTIITQPSLSSDGGSLVVQAQGIGSLSYQWLRNGQPVSGGTSAFLPISSLLGGTYSLVVSNGFSSAASQSFDSLDLTQTMGGPAGMKLIPAGTYQMGDALGDGESSDRPVHAVSVKSFYISETVITLSEWNNVKLWAEANGYTFTKQGTAKGSDHPVSVTWYDAVKWCNARSQKEGRVPVYYTTTWQAQSDVVKAGSLNLTNSMVKWDSNGYRLPTEAEWEKAARGAVEGKRFPWGDTISHQWANYTAGGFSYDMSSTTGYHPSAAFGNMPYTMPVKSFGANGYGLYDMAGNLWQWCWDRQSTYSQSAQSDPRGIDSGDLRQLRGGAWNEGAQCSRVDYHFMGATPVYNNAGFRVCIKAQ